MAHPQTSFPAFPSTLRRFGRRPWLTLLSVLALLGVVGGVIFASGTTTVIVELATVGNIPESAGNARFIVRLSDPIADGEVQITVRTVNGTGANGATAGSDFTSTEQTFTFTVADQGPRDFLVPIIDDTVDELNETFSVELVNLNSTSPTTVFLGQPFTAVIEDNDSPTLVSITGPATVDEGAGVVNFTVTMAESSPQPVTFQWQIVGAGANPITLPPAPGADIASAGGTWIIPANRPAGPSTFSVGIINDILPESDEQFELRITNVTNVANPATALAANIPVTILDNDGPPVIAVNTGLTVAEGGSGTIGQANLQASDGQQGPAQLTFTLTTAPANGTLFRDAVALSVGSTFTQADINANLISYTHNDSETTSDSFAFTVSDGFTPVGPASFTITVTPVNDPPVFDPDTYSATIPENTPAGDDVVTVTANDPDAGTTLTYSITAGNTGNAFTIDPATGAIRVSTPSVLNFTTQASYSLTVSVSDGDLTDTATVAITITNVNDPPVFDPDTYNATIPENTPAGDDVVSVSANDPDNDPLTYSITAGNTGNAFTIDPATGAIRVATPSVLDFETLASYTLTVSVSDGDLTDTATVTITLTNVNEAPVFDPDTYSATIPENTPAGDDVVTVTANDPDAGTTLTYSITAGNTGSAFTIDPATGAIRVSTPSVLNFTTQASYSLTVTVSDGDLTDTATVAITITNVNDPPVFDPDTYSATIPENTPAGDDVVSVSAADPDNDPLTYSITAGNTGNAFTIDPATGAIRVSTPSVLDFEALAGYTLTVSVSDGDLSDTATVTITITNVNEAPVFDPDTYSATIPENTPAGDDVVTVTANDPDAGTTLTYSITAGNTGSAFTIDPATGAIRVSTPSVLNFTTQASYTLTVTVSDGDLTDTATVTITITNVNDPPVFDPDTYNATIPEDTAAGDDVVSVSANDPDNDPLTYSITAGNTGNAFTIDPATGAIRVSTPSVLDFETLAGYTLTVSVSDGDLSDTATVTITITNVNEAPTAGDDTYTVAEDTTLNIDTASGVLDNDTDIETPAALVVSAVNGTTFTGSTTVTTTEGGTLFMRANGSFDYTPAADFFGADSFTYTVSDPDGATDTATVTITVTNVNDAPEIAVNTGLTVDEGIEATIGNTLLAAADVDNTPDERTFLVLTAPLYGELRLNGSALTAGDTFTQADIDAQRLSYAHDDSETPLSDSFQFVVTDPDAASAGPATFAITITPVNDRPVVDANGSAPGIDYSVPTAYAEGQATPLTIVDPGLTVTDDDTPTLATVVVTIDDLGNGADEELAVDAATATAEGITASYAAASGTLTLTGPATLEAFENVLRTLTYSNSAASPGVGRTISIVATDTGTPPAAGKPATLITLTITPAFEQPTLTNTGLTVNSGTTANLTPANLSAADPDTVAADLVFTITTAPTNGQLRRNNVALGAGGGFTQADIAAGLISYTHDGSATTSDSFGFSLTDGDTTPLTGTFAITVIPGNNAPVIVLTPGATTYAAGAPAVVIDGGALVSDADSSNFADGELRVALSGGNAGDVLGIRNEGNGAGQIGVSGNTVSYGGVAIGTFVAGSNSTPLVVNLNANATPAAAQALARNITFVNTLAAPVGGARTATFTLSDGDSGTSAPASKVITVETPITPPPPQQFTLYLPLQGLVAAPAAQPDLEVSAIVVNPAAPQAGAPTEVRVTVRNNGDAPASNFWVDFYINPTRAPGVNDPWNELCALDPCFGMAWFYTGTLAPGESVVLLSRPQDAQTPNGFVTASSVWPGFFANGTSKLYAVVDSWNRDTAGGVRDPNGAVIERNETNNRAEAAIVVTPGALPQARSFPAPMSLPERTGVR